MTGTAPRGGASADPVERERLRRYRAAQRAVARRHHPDAGGDADTYVAALAAVDAAFGQGSGRGPRPSTAAVSVRRTARGRLGRVLRRLRRLPACRRRTVDL